MHKRLFIVLNPTQYLNAVEYAYQTKQQENHLVFLSVFVNGLNPIDELGANKFWNSFHITDLGALNKPGNEKEFRAKGWQILNSKLAEIKPDELIVGNIADSFVYPFVLKYGRKFDKIMVLDDGTPTLDILQQKVNNNFFKAYNLRSIKEIIKWLVYFKVFSPFYATPKNLKFFTLFDAPFLKPAEVQTNNYAWLKSLTDKSELLNEVLFIGSNLPARNLVLEQDYLNSLVEIKNTFEQQGLQMKYARHRGEKQDVLEKIEQICPILTFNGPLELMFLNQPAPKVFASHFSSALFNLSRIYPETQNHAFLFPEEKLLGTSFESKDYLIALQNVFLQDSLIKCDHVLQKNTTKKASIV